MKKSKNYKTNDDEFNCESLKIVEKKVGLIKGGALIEVNTVINLMKKIEDKYF